MSEHMVVAKNVHHELQKHKDPTRHDFWKSPYDGRQNQNIGSLCLRGLLGPY